MEGCSLRNLNEVYSRLQGQDDKFTIYTYCLIRSGYANIVTDIAFIEEFTLPCEVNQAYVRFKGCLLDYILSGDFVRYMELEDNKKEEKQKDAKPLKMLKLSGVLGVL